jgi:hypothetical protein
VPDVEDKAEDHKDPSPTPHSAANRAVGEDVEQGRIGKDDQPEERDEEALDEDQDHARVSTATDHRSCPNLDLTFATIDAHEGSDGQSYRWRRKTPQNPIWPVNFTRDYVRRGFFKDKTYPQGRRRVVLEEHTLLGKVTHVDLRLPDGEFLFEVPVDYIKAEP